MDGGDGGGRQPPPDAGIDGSLLLEDAGHCADRDGDGSLAIECGGADCDDSDSTRSPDQTEVCDGSDVDEDCDPSTHGDRDADGDGYADATCCNSDDTTLRCGSDCNDSDPMVWPGEPETCDGVDNDCDDSIDEGALVTFYRDVDGDSYGVSTMTRTGCTAPLGHVPLDGDCDDARAAVHPGVSETCNSFDDDCDGTTDPGCACLTGARQACGTPDGTGGFVAVGECRPGEQECTAGAWGICTGNVAPATEACNDVDDDCDALSDEGVTRTFFRDDDADGAGQDDVMIVACSMPAGYAAAGGDCDDTSGTVSPVASEVCNVRDDDCDAASDEGVEVAFYADADADGFGAPPTQGFACVTPAGYVPVAGDCDDSASTVRPGASEACNLVDDDCDGVIDEGCECVSGSSRACGTSDGMSGFLSTGICRPGTQSCVSGAWTGCSGNVAPMPSETCNMLDDDCDARTDEGVQLAYYADCDGDTYGARWSIATLACTPPSAGPSSCPTAGWSTTATDCGDGSASMRPGAAEVCNQVDDDCDGATNEEPDSTTSCAPTTPPHANPICSAGMCTFVCATGYAGVTCDTCAPGFAGYPSCVVDPCYGVSCSGHGSCSGGACTCTTGYSGATCGTCAPGFTGYPSCAVDPCYGVSCNGHGICSEGTCTCATGYAGASCSACGPGYIGYPSCVADPCYGVTCSGHGTCSNGTCECDPAFSGPNCTACAVGYTSYPACDRIMCGDGVCGAGETSTSCCTDCGCASGSSCTGSACTATGARRIAAGYRHTCLVVPNGEVYCWGSNSDGQLGNGMSGSGTYSSVPVRVTGVDNAVSVSNGDAHTCVVLGDRTVRCWGWNANGQLGDGTMTRRTTPVAALGLSDVVQVTAGGDFTCARSSTGAVRCWGGNGWGQVGLGASGGNQVVPGGAAIASGALDVGAAGAHLCAVLSGGSVQCWGYGENGRVTGLALDHASYSTPQTVSGVSSALRVAPGANTGGFTCTTQLNGTAVCWGANSSGQCGNGGTTFGQGQTPGPVLMLDGIVHQDGGGLHSCVARTDGTVRCWGPDSDGRIGDGSTTSALSPRGVPGITDALEVAAGGNHSCALSRSGTVRCWGRSSEGQVGDGTTGDASGRRLLPVVVSGTDATGSIYARTRVCMPGGDPVTCECFDAPATSTVCNTDGSGWLPCPCEPSGGASPTSCVPATISSCMCPGGALGTRTCNGDGLGHSACTCTPPIPPTGIQSTLFIHGMQLAPWKAPRPAGDWEYWGGMPTGVLRPIAVNWDGRQRIEGAQAAIVEDALQAHCSMPNSCYIVCHSAGCIQTEYALDRSAYSNMWNIRGVVAAGSAEGGSEWAARAEIAYSLFGGLLGEDPREELPILYDLDPASAHALYGHDIMMRTNPVPIEMYAGSSPVDVPFGYNLPNAEIMLSFLLPGDDDGAVAFHSSLGLRTAGRYCRPLHFGCTTVREGDQGRPSHWEQRMVRYIDRGGTHSHGSIRSRAIDRIRELAPP